MTWIEAASGSSGLFENGFGWGGALLVIGMVIALAVVSGLGILARLRDRADERQAGQRMAAEVERPAPSSPSNRTAAG
jgi:cytochrome b